MSLELVVWRDAHFDKDDPETRDDYLMKTVGWARVEKRWLVVTSEKGPNGTRRANTFIPLENVVRRQALRK